MPSRREIIGTTAATATALSGCLDVGGSGGTGYSFQRGSNPVLPDHTIVAHQKAKSGDERGEVHTWATMYEPPADGRDDVRLVTEYRVYPPADTWKHTGFREIHDWSVGADEQLVRDHWTNMGPTSEPNSPLDVEDRSSSYQGRWVVHLTPPISSAVTYRFVTVIQSQDFSEGDLIAESRAEARFEEEGWFGEETTLAMETQLVYGDVTDR